MVSCTTSLIGEQRSFTNGRIIVAGGKVRRGKQKPRRLPAVLPARFPVWPSSRPRKSALPAETGVQQAREYAEMLGLKFAYATNGHRIIEIDYTTGTEREVDRYATPARTLAAADGGPSCRSRSSRTCWNRSTSFPARCRATTSTSPSIASSRLSCSARSASWPRWPPAPARPALPFRSAGSSGTAVGTARASTGARKILFLADRNILVDDPMAKMFAPFGDARHKIAGGDVSQSRDMYFGIYQALPHEHARTSSASTAPTSST